MAAARAKRWEGHKPDQPTSTPEAQPDPEPPPQADPQGTVRDRTGKIITNLGDANILKNIWAYARPYCPNRAELKAITQERKSCLYTS